MVKIYIEGAERGNMTKLCRKAFSNLLSKFQIAEKSCRIIPSGTRSNAFRVFKSAIKDGDDAILLVDSEDFVTAASNWEHLAKRTGDKWVRPAKAKESDCHLMVQMMEAWLVVDRTALERYYGQGFHTNALPSVTTIESVPKTRLLDALKSATKATAKKNYHKGRDSFKLLEMIDPHKVAQASPKAKSFFEEVQRRTHS
jgi:hypothetical protein